MEKDILCTWKQERSRGSNTHIRQNRLLKKGHLKDQKKKTTKKGKPLLNDKGICIRRYYPT